jgi:hypothetical protein
MRSSLSPLLHFLPTNVAHEQGIGGKTWGVGREEKEEKLEREIE